MPTGRNALHCGGIPLKDGVFAVVEGTTFVQDIAQLKSDLMVSVVKDVELDEDGSILKRTFYLADTEAFMDPCCVIPDLGGPSNQCFVVKPRNQWAQEFVRWLDDPHNLDEMDPLKAEESEDDEEEEELESDEDMASSEDD